VQAFLRLVLSFSALPGNYGVDEEESERVLGFWYLFQEALWMVEFAPSESEVVVREKEMWALAKAVYAELVAVLRNKVRWPTPPSGWAKGARLSRCPKGRKRIRCPQIRSRDSRCMFVCVGSLEAPTADENDKLSA
jgi:hypothetical protein